MQTAASRMPRGPSWLTFVVAVAAIASVASFVYFYRQDATLLYSDAKSHELIARRFWLSPTPGFGQLGAVWPMLPHLMMLPFVWNDFLFYSGIAGSIVSMACFVGTVPFIFKLTEAIGGTARSAAVASLVFVLNPNVLYMQSTPMSELPLFFFTTAGVYFLVRWAQEPDRYGLLMATALFLACATLTRYEAWFVLALAAPIVFAVGWRAGFDRWKLVAHLVWFAPAFLGLALWIGWNVLLKHNPLYFYAGEHAAPSVWVGADDTAAGDLLVALKTYWYGIADTNALPLVGIATAGVALFLWRERTRMGRFTALLLLFPVPFFAITLYGGQRPMHVIEVTGTLYNVRFALLMVLPIAVYAGYLTGRRSLLQAGLLGVVVATAWVTFSSHSIATLQEPLAWTAGDANDAQSQTAAWLHQHYDGGYVLAESFENERVHFDSRVPTSRLLYEGSNEFWQAALAQPSDYAEWVVMREGGARPDAVWDALAGAPVMDERYALVYENESYRVFRLHDGSASVASNAPMRSAVTP